MATEMRVWMLEEVHRLPDDGNKYELVRGELLVTPASTVDPESESVTIMQHGRDDVTVRDELLWRSRGELPTASNSSSISLYSRIIGRSSKPSHQLDRVASLSIRPAAAA